MDDLRQGADRCIVFGFGYQGLLLGR